jgi:hypothetical protein
MKQTAASLTVAIGWLDDVAFAPPHELLGLGFGFLRRGKGLPIERRIRPADVIVRHGIELLWARELQGTLPDPLRECPKSLPPLLGQSLLNE